MTTAVRDAPPATAWPPVTVPGQPERTTRQPLAELTAEPKPSGDQSAVVTGPFPVTNRPTGTAGHLTAVTDREPVTAVGQPTGPVDPPPRNALAEGADLLTELRSAVARYVVMPSGEALDAVTLWVAATHLQPAWQHAPRLAVVGPAKRCGKSRLLDVPHDTVHDPFITVNSTPAAIFRSITEQPPTLLVDEADTIFGSVKVAEKNEEMRGLLNSGHQRNRPTTRVVGPEHKPTKFRTFAMAALAGIGDLPDTIMDRAVVVRMRMRRRGPGEKVLPFRSRRDTPQLHDLRDRLAGWLVPLTDVVASMEPLMPVEDRAADSWEPLVAVADLAGGSGPQRARQTCCVLAAQEEAVPVEFPDLRSVHLGRAGSPCCRCDAHTRLRRLTCPSVPVSLRWCFKGSPGPRGLPFGPGHQDPYPAGYAAQRVETAALRFSPGLSAYRYLLLGPSCSCRGVELPLRSAYRACPGPRQGFRVPHAEDAAGVGAPYVPWPTVSQLPVLLAPAAVCVFQRGPIPADCTPSTGFT
jgi:hypothetical protein